MALNHDLKKSPVAHLLKSNEPPTTIEEMTIKTLLDQHLAELDQLATTPHISKETSNIETNCRSFVSQHRALLSRLRTLPTELLQDIFLCYTAHNSSTSILSVLLLSQVCVRWRSVTFSLPTLWARLPFLSLNRKSQRSATYKQLVEACIRRSESFPLTFFLDDQYQTWATHPILDLIVRHSKRWGNITLTACPTTIAYSLHKIQDQLPMLHSVHLYINAEAEDEDLPNISFSNTPNLQHVSIHNVSPPITLPWSQLTSYEEHVYRSTGLSHLSQASNLQKLVITWRGGYSLSASLQITLAKLSSLSINTITYRSQGVNILDCLNLPALQEVEARDRSLLVSKLTSMIQRSTLSKGPSQIRKLTLRLLRLSGVDESYQTFLGRLETLFNLLPMLEDLEIAMGKVDGIQTLLGWSGTGKPLLPRLQRITLQVGDRSDTSNAAVVEDLRASRTAYIDSLPQSDYHHFSATIK